MMLEGIRIQRMNEEDVAGVLEIQEELKFQNWTSQHFLSEIRDIHYSLPFIAKSDRIHGYLILKILADESELCSIAVQASKQGTGLADLLLDTGIAELKKRGVIRLFLEVRKSNARAIQYYRRNAFQEQGVRAKYYSDGEDAVLMFKNLETE